MTNSSAEPPTILPERSSYDCCSGSLIGVNETGDAIKVIPLFCHRWTCPRCRKHKAGHWREIAKAGDPDKFLTFTIRENKNIPVKLLAQNMKKAWSLLLQKIRYTFGEFEYLMIWELQKNGMPHFHMLARCGFIPQGWLSSEWFRLTGAFKVDIRKVRRKTDIANYITKYMGKAISDVAEAMHGLRIIQKSKNWDIRTDDEKKSPAAPDDLGINDFSFCFCHPQKIYKYLKENKSFNLDKDSSETCWLLRGPPRPDLESEVLWKMVQEKGFREASG